MASSVFIWPGDIVFPGNITFSGNVAITGTLTMTGQILAANGSASAPSIAFASETNTGWYRNTTNSVALTIAGTPEISINAGFGLKINKDFGLGWTAGDATNSTVDTVLARDAANTLALRNGTNAQTFRTYGYLSGSRSTYEAIQAVTTAVTLSGATTGTGNVIPAGATVVDIATTTTTAITGASGYQVGDGSDADRYGDITGTAVGTASGSTSYTADPRWWATSARAVTLTAKTSNFTGGVVQVTVFYMAATGA